MPPRKPTHLKIVEGTAKQHPGRLNRDEPQPGGTLGKPPPRWRKEERAIWKADAVFWATAADRGAFISYCEARADADRARAKMKGEFYTLGSKGTLILHPLFRVMLERERDANRMAVEFGLTPASRGRVKAPDRRSQAIGADLID